MSRKNEENSKRGRFGINRRIFIKILGLAGMAVFASLIFSHPILSSNVFSPKLPVGSGDVPGYAWHGLD
jgi:hypothetical protein